MKDAHCSFLNDEWFVRLKYSSYQRINDMFLTCTKSWIFNFNVILLCYSLLSVVRCSLCSSFKTFLNFKLQCVFVILWSFFCSSLCSSFPICALCVCVYVMWLKSRQSWILNFHVFLLCYVVFSAVRCALLFLSARVCNVMCYVVDR